MWNRPENANADIKEGSLIAWLRYAQVYLRPIQKVVPVATETIPDDYNGCPNGVETIGTEAVENDLLTQPQIKKLYPTTMLMRFLSGSKSPRGRND